MKKTKDFSDVGPMYSIGEVAKICNVSRKTLRYYEQLGLLKPDHVCFENGYRYYTEQTMNSIPVIKYYKQMGFKLQEMKIAQNTENYFYHEQENIFLTKLEELKQEERRIRNSYGAIAEWLGMIREGNIVASNQLQEINVKYLEEETYVYIEQEFNQNYMDAVINIPWVNYLESHNCEIMGPVILGFEGCKNREEYHSSKVKIMQKPVGRVAGEMPTQSIGGQFFLSSYHIGDLSLIGQQYKNMRVWAKEHRYQCEDKVYERHLVDYWSTMNEDSFVVELLIPAKKVNN
ncbi:MULTISPECIES: MerR family transcriptional regulator [unclassified Enterococcus]|uniref:MerR family transcriptional regulator n=1 Tax=unclassified Enterococcus TaxID=2608891 RepID=UPI001A9B1ADA|nr:helix-turn-helix domain-containing protein [Enterococcus sp. DIV1271a]MBO1300610.1 MerR family transcriptional regulator [Enterococcus sp. DIV1271a]